MAHTMSTSPKNRRPRRARNAAVDPEEHVVGLDGGAEDPHHQQPRAVGRSVAAHVRDRQRAVAEREAARLARPEIQATRSLAHADPSKSAVASTPAGVWMMGQQKSSTSSSSSGGGSGKPTNDTEQPPVEEWCGPFSVARQLIAKREEAKRLREQEDGEDGDEMHHPLDSAMLELEMEQKRKAHPSMQWKASFKQVHSSSTTSFYAKRQKRADLLLQSRGGAVPPLFALCVQFLVDHFDSVESLGIDMDAQVRTAVAHSLIASQKLDGPAWTVIAEAGIESLQVPDCSGIGPEDMAERLGQLCQAGLQFLNLDQCGRGFTNLAVQAIVDSYNDQSCHGDSNSPIALTGLSIGGAYSLQDDDAALLVKKTFPSSLEFKACNLLGKATCQSIAETYSSPRCTLVELALEDIAFSEQDLQSLLVKPEAFQNLQNLSFKRVIGLTDALVTEFIRLSAATLEGLDLTDNHQLTDAVLAGIRLHHVSRLHSLTMSGLKQLTSVGLEAFFTHVQGATQPPMLRTLNLSHCHPEAITDDVLHLASLAATYSREASLPAATDSDHAVEQGHQHEQRRQQTDLGGLVDLNVQGSTLVTDTSMEHLVATSSRTLQVLNVCFCTKISDQGLGYLVDKCGRQLRRIEVWGNAQLTDVFLDGNNRSADSTLEIVGVWMKKNTSKTIR